MRDWVTNVRTTYYMLGSVLGPHPYPVMVRDFQSVIGRETRAQILEKEGRLPDVLVACVGGGSNAIGLFYDFVRRKQVRMIGVEAGGRGRDLVTMRHDFQEAGRACCTERSRTFFRMKTARSSRRIRFPPVSIIRRSGPNTRLARCRPRRIHVDQRCGGVGRISRTQPLEGIIPALESSHAIAQAKKLKLPEDQIVVVNLSGRGDKDVNEVMRLMGKRSAEQARANRS